MDAHLRAALETDRAGLIDETLGLAGHPEAEVMADLRPELESRGAADFSDAIWAYADLIADDVPDANLVAAFDAIAATSVTAIWADGDHDIAAAAGIKVQQFLAGAAGLIEACITHDPSILHAAAAQVALAGLRIE